MIDASDFRVRLCRDTSVDQINETLKAEWRMEVGVTESMDIYVTHKGSHWDILEDSGIPESDFLILGNVSLGGVGLFRDDARVAIVRFKSNQATRQFVECAQSAIIEFLRPLRYSV